MGTAPFNPLTVKRIDTAVYNVVAGWILRAWSVNGISFPYHGFFRLAVWLRLFSSFLPFLLQIIARVKKIPVCRDTVTLVELFSHRTGTIVGFTEMEKVRTGFYARRIDPQKRKVLQRKNHFALTGCLS
jgi:hypothetical protein